MPQSFFIFFISLFLFTISTAQVIIKEKVDINPQAVFNNTPNLINEHMFTYTFTWTPSEFHRGNIKITTCSDDVINSGWSTSGQNYHRRTNQY